LRRDLEKYLLVQGKDVVRYHADSDSEDADEESEEDEEDSDSEDESDKETNKQSISVPDEGLIPRFAKFGHCDEEFDVTSNERGTMRSVEGGLWKCRG
jgi:hypothetical protein